VKGKFYNHSTAANHFLIQKDSWIIGQHHALSPVQRAHICACTFILLKRLFIPLCVWWRELGSPLWYCTLWGGLAWGGRAQL